jgi:hypothetical protein
MFVSKMMAFSVSGNISTDKGLPINDAYVNYGLESNISYQVKTSTGSFLFFVEMPSTYTISVGAPNFITQTTSVFVNKDISNVNFSLSPQFNSEGTINDGLRFYTPYGWELPKGIVSMYDLSNQTPYFYIIGYKDSHFLVKFSTDTNNNLFYDRMINLEGTYQVDYSNIRNIGENLFVFNSTSGHIAVYKYDKNLGFVSSGTISATSRLIDITDDGSYLYGCLDDGGIRKISTTFSVVSSTSTLSCKKIVYNNNKIYVLNDNKIYVLTKSSSSEIYIYNDNLDYITSTGSAANMSYENFEVIKSSIVAFRTVWSGDNWNIIITTYTTNLENKGTKIFTFPMSYDAQMMIVDVKSTPNQNYIAVLTPNNGAKDSKVFLFDVSNIWDIKLKQIYDIPDMYPRKIHLDNSNIYIAGTRRVNYNGTLTDDIFLKSFPISSLSVNTPPQLLWANEPNYQNRGVDKLYGIEGDTFTFKVLFNDLDGDSTDFMRVKICSDNQCSNVLKTIDMNLGGVSNVPQGMIGFSTSIVLNEGAYYYKFEAKDNNISPMYATGYPTQVNGPIIIKKGFEGDLNNGLVFFDGSKIKPKQIKVKGDYVYSVSERDGDIFVMKYSTGTNSQNKLVRIYEPYNVSKCPWNYDYCKPKVVGMDVDTNGNLFVGIKKFIDASENGELWDLIVYRYDKDLISFTSTTYSKQFETAVSSYTDEPYSLMYYNGGLCSFIGRDGIACIDPVNLTISTTGWNFSSQKLNDLISSVSRAHFSDVEIKNDKVYLIAYSTNGVALFAAEKSGDLYDISTDTSTSFYRPFYLADYKNARFAINDEYIYLAFTVNNGQKNNWMIVKSTVDVNDNNKIKYLDSVLYDAGDNGEFSNIKLDSAGNIYLIGKKSNGFDNNKASIIVKYNKDLNFLADTIVNNGYTSGVDFEFSSDNNIYVLSAFENTMLNEYKPIVKKIADLSGLSLKTVTVNVKNKNTLVNLENVKVALLPFNEKGEPDPSLAQIGKTDSNGNAYFNVKAGVPYFIAITTPGYGPTIKEQMMDPLQNFIKVFNTNTTVNYQIGPISNSTNTITINISNVYPGAILTADVSLAKTNENISFGIVKATSTTAKLEIHNVPNLNANDYLINISIPNWLNISTSPNVPVNTNRVFELSFSSAMPPVINFEQVHDITKQPVFSGIVLDKDTNNPIPNVSVRIYNQCLSSDCRQINVYTSDDGRFNIYDIDITQNWCLNLLKLGYKSLPSCDPIVVNNSIPQNFKSYTLEKATYSLTGVITNFGKPIAYAKVSLQTARCDWSGSDSYSNNNKCNEWVRYETYLDGNGRFSFNGLDDGNYSLSIERPFWKDITEGKNIDWSNIDDDDIRITVSSSGAIPPQFPYNNPCKSGEVWILDSSGTCKGIMPYAFDIGDETIMTDSKLSGNLIFATTYTITAQTPLVISFQSPIMVVLEEDCYDKCNNRSIFTSTPIYGSFYSNSVPYEINAISQKNNNNVKYHLNIVSDKWAKANSFDNEVIFDTSTIVRDIKLTPAGKFIAKLKKPDGSFFIPRYEPNAGDIRIHFRGIDVDYDWGGNLDWETGLFELPNVPGGRYRMNVTYKSTTTVYSPIEIEDIIIKPGQTTEIVANLKEGLFVKPQIYGIPQLPSPKYGYAVLAVESGKKMNRELLNSLLFSEPKYFFNYDTTTQNWSMMPMEEGVYDFYFVLYSHYEPDFHNGEPNFEQFVNFIGKQKGVQIKKDENNPSLGSVNQPIPVSIMGTIGNKEIKGWIKGNNVFTERDYQRIFAQGDVNSLIPLIPTLMIYDSAGEIRGFAHSLPSTATTFGNFWNYLISKSSTGIQNQIEQGTFTYHIYGLPQGDYTAVFANPNYPLITKQITIPLSGDYNFDFDEQKIKTGNVRGLVFSSSTENSPLVGALVYLKGKTLEKSVYTDNDGKFVFDNIAPGSYKLEISRDGFVKIGKKFVLEDLDLDLGKFYLEPSITTISGRVLLSRFPQPMTKKGIKVYAYDETLNTQYNTKKEYIPTIVSLTDDKGNFTLDGIVAGHNYRIVVSEKGKMTYTNIVSSETIKANQDNNIGEIVLLDLPPQIKVIVRKNPENEKKAQVVIKSPKKLNSIPSCSYSEGTTFDENNSASIALVPGPNNTYIGEFTASLTKKYTVRVTVGDVLKLQKDIIYDGQAKVKTDQYAYEAGLIGGDLYVDEEKEEFSGLSFDPGSLTQSTSSLSIASSGIKVMSSGGDDDLIGGFFKALPNVRTIKTSKGDLTLDEAIKSIMASEVYNINLENAEPNKAFTLNLQYDKEKVSNPNSLRIYQYTSSGVWKEVKGTYNIDPVLGIVSVDVESIEKAYEDTTNSNTPFGRKQLKMSAISPKGYFVPQGSSSQSGQFAVFIAKPPTGKNYTGSSYEVYNMPNPFNLKDKTVTISSDGGSWYQGAYTTRGTIIKYFLPSDKSGHVKFVIYNMAGEKVRTLDEGQRDGGQIYYSEWDGRNDRNEDVASGVYLLVTFINGDKVGKPHKMAVIK